MCGQDEGQRAFLVRQATLAKGHGRLETVGQAICLRHLRALSIDID